METYENLEMTKKKIKKLMDLKWSLSYKTNVYVNCNYASKIWWIFFVEIFRFVALRSKIISNDHQKCFSLTKLTHPSIHNSSHMRKSCIFSVRNFLPSERFGVLRAPAPVYAAYAQCECTHVTPHTYAHTNMHPHDVNYVNAFYGWRWATQTERNNVNDKWLNSVGWLSSTQ